jgi:Spy/CpxP family protein refolding chaperone
MKTITAIGAALALASAAALAQGPGSGYGPGMMGGYGPGMMGGYGPGMMGGYGPGMMGGGYGPGGGGGYGPGMMGGGTGRGFGGPFAALDLTDEQQDKLFAIREDNRRKNFERMSQVRSEAFKLRRMYDAEGVDSKALLEQQKKVDDLRREMLASRLEMRKQVESVLTPEQRKQARQFGPWWAQEDE